MLKELARNHPKFSLSLEVLCLLPCEPKHFVQDCVNVTGALLDEVLRDLGLRWHREVRELMAHLEEQHDIHVQVINKPGGNRHRTDIRPSRREWAPRALRVRRGDWERAHKLCDDYQLAVYGTRRAS